MTPTPKEKAKELFDKFHDPIMIMYGASNWTYVTKVKKQCALLLIDELIDLTPSVDTMPPNFGKPTKGFCEFWQEVKIENENYNDD